MKYYVDNLGNYLGSFSDNNPAIPQGAIEVPNQPEHARQIWDGSTWVCPKHLLSEHLANYRYIKEISGTNLEGLPLPTDDRSKTLIVGAYNNAIAENNPEATKSFKINGSFISITNQQIIYIGLAVVAHVQKCFDCESQVYIQIQNGSLTNREAVESAFDAAYAS